jgi:hypothetical protein
MNPKGRDFLSYHATSGHQMDSDIRDVNRQSLKTGWTSPSNNQFNILAGREEDNEPIDFNAELTLLNLHFLV